MATTRAYFIPGEGYINEAKGNAYFIPGQGYINETVTAAATGTIIPLPWSETTGGMQDMTGGMRN